MIVRNSLGELFDKVRPLGSRPDQTHVAFQYAKELRYFIEMCPTQKLPDACDSTVVTSGPDRPRLAFSVRLHRSEFPKRKDLAILPYSFLPMKYGTSRIELDEQSNHRKKRQEEHEQH